MRVEKKIKIKGNPHFFLSAFSQEGFTLTSVFFIVMVFSGRCRGGEGGGSGGGVGGN